MAEITIIGVDIAKSVFQLHGAHADGSVGFRKKLTPTQFLPFLTEQPDCIVAMEACATAHGWGREIGQLGHTIKLDPTAVCETVCQASEKRYGGGDRRSGLATDHAICRGENR